MPSLSTRLCVAGAAILFTAYWIIFYLTTSDSALAAMITAANNTLPAIGLAWLVHVILERHVWTQPLPLRLVVQLPFAVLFALVWYLAILVVRELRGPWLSEGFAIQPFVPVAFAWQMFQGVTFYALAALASLAIVQGRKLRETLDERATASGHAGTSLLLRTNDGSQTVSIDSLIVISGAGDYSEVALPGRSIYSTTTLAEFESRLPQDQFLRAHRSHLVRLGAIERSEPAGNGRTVLHLQDGRSITTSRAGTRLLRGASL